MLSKNLRAELGASGTSRPQEACCVCMCVLVFVCLWWWGDREVLGGREQSQFQRVTVLCCGVILEGFLEEASWGGRKESRRGFDHR